MDIAAAGTGSGAAIVLGRDGAFRMLDPAGWSLPALKEEFGAKAVFKLERRSGRIRIEASDGDNRCLLERSAPASGDQAETAGTIRLQGRGSGALELAAIHPHECAARVRAERCADYSQNQRRNAFPEKRAVYL